MNDINQVTLVGTISSEFIYSHEAYNEKFYYVYVSVKRDSGTTDLIPVLFSERIIDTKENYANKMVMVTGKFRSYNSHTELGSKLVLYVFVLNYEWIDEGEDTNQIYLEGHVCKPPIYRKTPLGREIADILVAVNRPYGKSDYIPCICWGRNARFADGFKVGEHIQVWGRIQSRGYQKKLDDDITEVRTAYEISVAKLDIIDEQV